MQKLGALIVAVVLTVLFEVWFKTGSVVTSGVDGTGLTRKIINDV